VPEVGRLSFSTWDEYKHEIVPLLFRDSRFRPGRYLFRGCSDSDHALVSSFDRRFSDLPTAKRMRLWASMLAGLKEAGVEHRLPSSVIGDDHRLLAFAQHHGLPTRLLDWTLSPYVAAFFAFRQSLERSHPAQHVAVWALDSTSTVWSAELGVEILSPPSIENVRLRNQAGRFTYARTAHVSLEDYVEQSNDEGRPLVQISVPSHEVIRALPDLEAMGLSAEYLFPDFTGVTETIALRAQLDAID
jgi:hypothetical protein